MALIYLSYLIAIFYWQLRRARRGVCGKRKALITYIGCALAPTILYGVAFMGLVGIEELTESALISEPFARALPFVLVGGTAVTGVSGLLFALLVYFVGAAPGLRK